MYPISYLCIHIIYTYKAYTAYTMFTCIYLPALNKYTICLLSLNQLQKEEKRAHALRQFSDSSRSSACTTTSSSAVSTSTATSNNLSGEGDMLQCGLFEAARLANPVLPQYHPKQVCT